MKDLQTVTQIFHFYLHLLHLLHFTDAQFLPLILLSYQTHRKTHIFYKFWSHTLKGIYSIKSPFTIHAEGGSLSSDHI